MKIQKETDEGDSDDENTGEVDLGDSDEDSLGLGDDDSLGLGDSDEESSDQEGELGTYEDRDTPEETESLTEDLPAEDPSFMGEESLGRRYRRRRRY